MRRSNNRDCSLCLRGSDTSTRGGSCVDFLRYKAQSALCHGWERGTGNVRACYQHQPPFPAKHSNIYSICTNRSPPMAVGWKENRRAVISGKRRMFQLRAEADALSSFLPVSCQLLTCSEHLKTMDLGTRELCVGLTLMFIQSLLHQSCLIGFHMDTTSRAMAKQT